MFTVLSKTRNSSLYLIAALATLMVITLTLAIVPAIPAPQSVVIPVTARSETMSDYFQRHPELKLGAAVPADMVGDFALRHPEWAISSQNAALPATGTFEGSDYFQRHPVLSMPAVITVDTADYFTRHPELRPSAPSIDLSDYFLRH